MTQSLLICVRLHEARWHGAGAWPPSPARLFQALVAGLGAVGVLAPEHVRGLRWLQALPPPTIAAPPASHGQGFVNFVPNNDLDALGGDPRRIHKISARKTIRPRLIEGEPVIAYMWRFEAGADADACAALVQEAAHGLYQFGRGVDMAWATADVLAEEEAEARLSAHSGPVWQPSDDADTAAGGVALRCPDEGTLRSLIDRHADQRRRIAGGVFRKPRDARFRLVAYDSPPDRLLLELRPADDGRRFQPWPLVRAAELATTLRDAAERRLAAAGVAGSDVDRYLVGRGADAADKPRRVRIIPLPSVGHAHADPSIRRVLVERPPDCPIPLPALDLALANLDLATHDPLTGEVLSPSAPVLAPTADADMLRHYGIGVGGASRVWHSVTPVALPVARLRGRVTGSRRLENEADAAHALRQALRHAGVAGDAEAIRLQREPLFGKGARAEAFAAGSRFAPDRLWHVAITFTTAVAGPLVIGDGRFCGLGVMAPSARYHHDVLVLPILGPRPAVTHRHAVIAALRRALMSRAADEDRRVPTLFSGHEEGPGPARSGRHRHVYLLAEDSDDDGLLDRLLVVAPWRVDRTVTPSLAERRCFERVVADVAVVRAGVAGVLRLDQPRPPAEHDPLFASASVWTSCTPYRPTRHASHGADLEAAARQDLATECLRRGLPKPRIEIRRLDVGPRGGISGEACLRFATDVIGPILLGRDAHQGGGLFVRGA
jgi:CRISPR-associated protein Csb2